MSIGVRLKVRTFGNKHPDGSNVRILFLDQIIVLHEHKCSLERTFIIKSYLIIIMIINNNNNNNKNNNQLYFTRVNTS